MTKQTCAVKTLAQIQADPKYRYTDKDGKVRERTLNIPHYFKEIPFIYSPLLEKGKVKFSATMQKLYCCVKDWEKSGSVCYEEQSELAKVCGLSRGKTNELIGEMVLIGLLSRDPIDRRRNKELRALPLTDAHVIPPDQLSAAPESDAVQQQPEPATAEELNAPDLDDIPFACDEPDYATAEPESASLREMITDDVTIDALCDLLSKPDSLQQHNRGDTFIDFARRVLRLKRKILPHKLEKGLEERYASRHPAYYKPRFDDFDIPF